MTVLIAGAGIAGLTLGLTLHQLKIPFRIYEAVETLKPLGVGINIQPHAVRELLALGLGDALERSGVPTRDYGFYTKTGLEIWTEPRGRHAGYAWPQYSVHRGQLQMELFGALIQRAGADVVVTGHAATGFDSDAQGATLHLHTKGRDVSVRGSAVIAADGINSALRAQIAPEEGAPLWNGCVLWRGVSKGVPFGSGASMILAGHDTQRFVAYPISAPDGGTGLADINWIAEIKRDPGAGWRQADYHAAVDVDTFAPAFAEWRFDWLDVPQLIASAPQVMEYPMVDRDPLPRWTHGRMTLMGDAAHPAYPVGSNGASQAVVDARLIGAAFQQYGITQTALETFEAKVRPMMAQVVAANRSGGGPDGIMQMVEDRCGGVFDDIEHVIPRSELAAHAEKYKALAGFSVEDLNNRPPALELEA